MDNESMKYIYNGILFNHEKKRNLAICNNTERKRSDKESLIFIICYIWNLKKKNHRSKECYQEGWLPMVGDGRNGGDIGQKVQTSSYKMIKP